MRLPIPFCTFAFMVGPRRRADIDYSKMFIGGLNWETTEGTYAHVAQDVDCGSQFVLYLTIYELN